MTKFDDDMLDGIIAKQKDIIRAAFERITETTYEGEFAKYPDGDYVNEIQQYQWEGFHDGWKAALKHKD